MIETNPVPFFMIILAIGEVLKTDTTVNAQKVQDIIAKDDSFGGIRIPLQNCRLALQLACDSKFIAKTGEDEYIRFTGVTYPLHDFDKMELPDYGDIFTLEKFTMLCMDGVVTGEDGHGYYCDNEYYYMNNKAIPSDFVVGRIDKKNFKKVIWFNK